MNIRIPAPFDLPQDKHQKTGGNMKISFRGMHWWLGVLVLWCASVPGLQAATEVTTYDELVKAIRQTRQESKLRVQKAVEQEKVRESWEIGKLIDEHVLQHKERADYGKQVIERLSGDLGMSETELYYMLDFARSFKNFPMSGNLSWSHYREMLAVNDPAEVEQITAMADKEKWNVFKVREEVRKRKAAKAQAEGTDIAKDDPVAEALPEITPGPLYTYPIIRLKDKLKIDLGFGIYWDVPEADAGELEAGDVVHLEGHQLRKVTEGYDMLRDVPEEDQTQPLETSGNLKVTSRNPDVTPRNANVTSRNFKYFTYNALVTSVVDGDTFHALIDLGLGGTLAQRVRLRRIDAPELPTSAGEQAKALLEKILARDHGKVILQSRELDQHGRPIADVFVHGTSKSRHEAPEASASGAGWVSVDQELVDNGLASILNE